MFLAEKSATTFGDLPDCLGYYFEYIHVYEEW